MSKLANWIITMYKTTIIYDGYAKTIRAWHIPAPHANSAFVLSMHLSKNKVPASNNIVDKESYHK